LQVSPGNWSDPEQALYILVWYMTDDLIDCLRVFVIVMQQS